MTAEGTPRKCRVNTVEVTMLCETVTSIKQSSGSSGMVLGLIDMVAPFDR